ncbi:DUF177 domain-containing protein [Microvirga massiliensis]|uniref:YceD family protein n=1 Tax=Microvirga massiliensis TaxID=1033741 RepID=UPI000AB5D113
MTTPMTPEAVGPLSRPLDVSNLPATGVRFEVRATQEECDALATDFKLPAIHDLIGEYKVTGSARGVHVEGRVRARITQTCVVTLDPFETSLDEEVMVDFAEPRHIPAEPPVDHPDYDPPDEILDGRIDLGALTAEFLALGLDPYPRKPGVDFKYENDGDEADSPFAALGRLRKDG